MKKIKKYFRIFEYKKGFLPLYRAQIKTWIGWRSFNCYETGAFYFDREPNTSHLFSKEHIENYRKLKGLNKDEIEISHVIKK